VKAFFIIALVLAGCTGIEITESPKTAFVTDTGEPKTPELMWNSRPLKSQFDYLGQIQVRAWGHEGAIEKIIEGGKRLRADAVVDIHYEKVGFITEMHAFAIKYK